MAEGYITTHVLDTARGRPAAGLRIALARKSDSGFQNIAEAVTNSDGRTDAPILGTADFSTGEYELVFSVGDYLRGFSTAEASFLGEIPIRFKVDEAAHYHVPLLLSPFGYSTYRGS